MMATQEYYDALANYYDEATKVPGAWLPNTYLLKRLKKFLNLRPQSALDLGAGTGQTSEIIRQLFPDIPVTAVDFSKRMLAILSQHHVDFVVINRDIVDFTRVTKASWPLITAVGSLEFIPQLPDLISQIYNNLLAPGGVLVFTYEPLIPGSALQGKDKTQEQAGAAFDNKVFTIFRYTPASIHKALLRQNATIKLDEEFVAYYKGGESIVYHLIIAQKLK